MDNMGFVTYSKNIGAIDLKIQYKPSSDIRTNLLKAQLRKIISQGFYFFIQRSVVPQSADTNYLASFRESYRLLFSELKKVD